MHYFIYFHCIKKKVSIEKRIATAICTFTHKFAITETAKTVENWSTDKVSEAEGEVGAVKHV